MQRLLGYTLKRLFTLCVFLIVILYDKRQIVSIFAQILMKECPQLSAPRGVPSNSTQRGYSDGDHSQQVSRNSINISI